MKSHKISILFLVLIHNQTTPMWFCNCLKKQKVYPLQRHNSSLEVQSHTNSHNQINNNTEQNKKTIHQDQQKNNNLLLNILRKKTKQTNSSHNNEKELQESPRNTPMTPCNTPQELLSKSSSNSELYIQQKRILCDSPRKQHQPASPNSSATLSDGSTSPRDGLQQENIYPFYSSIKSWETEIRTVNSDPQLNDIYNKSKLSEHKMLNGNQSDNHILIKLKNNHILLNLRPSLNTQKQE